MKTSKSIYDMNIGDTSVIKILLPNTNFYIFNFNQLFIIEIEDVEICIRQKDAKNIQIGG